MSYSAYWGVMVLKVKDRGLSRDYPGCAARENEWIQEQKAYEESGCEQQVKIDFDLSICALRHLWIADARQPPWSHMRGSGNGLSERPVGPLEYKDVGRVDVL